LDAQSQWTGLDAKRLDNIADHLERNYLAPRKIAGCQLAITRRGHPAYFRSFGLMDRERGRPMADDTIFRIFSMTKPIASIALMQLFEKGHFQLSDPVSRFIPSWRDHRVWVSGHGPSMVTEPPVRPVSMRDVLAHTGGLTYGGALSAIGAADEQDPVDAIYAEAGITRDGGDTLAEFAHKLGHVPLRYQPGERWMYSYSTDVCGALVEIISGRPLDRYIAEAITGPLGMVDTAFHVAPEKAARLAANYRRAADKSLQLADDPATSDYLKPPKFLSGGAGLTGTAADYMRFCEALRRGGELDGARIIGPRTLELMRMNHLKDGLDLAGLAVSRFADGPLEGAGFGLGFAMTLDHIPAGSISAGEYYWGGAASTLFWVDPREDLCVVFMTQCMPMGVFNFRGQLKNLIYSAIVD
jgi:CubicO group peptidase (beta-lactamase class C family)